MSFMNTGERPLLELDNTSLFRDEDCEYAEMRSLLSSWGLPQYIQTFEENAVTASILAILSEDEINALIPKVGHKALFRRNWQRWVQDMHPNLDESIEQTESVSNNLDLPSVYDLDTNTIVVEKCGSNASISSSNEFLTSSSPAPCALPNKSNNNLTLKALLEESLEGKYILQQTQNHFTDSTRSRLCKIICIKILHENSGKPITSDVYIYWAHQIKSLFPSEHSSVYFHRSLRDGAKGMVYRIQGKLPDMIHNLRKKYKAANVIEGINKSVKSTASQLPAGKKPRLEDSSSLNIVPENLDSNLNVEDSLQWLKNSSDPWVTVEEKWIETNKRRMKDIISSDGPSIYETLKTYPALSNPKGYALLVKDYDLAYPKNTDGLHKNYPLMKQGIFEFAKSKNSTNQALKHLLELQNSTEETSNLASLLLLPQIISTGFIKGLKKGWKPSKAEVCDSFICHVKNELELLTALSRRKQKVSDFGVTVQPSIFIVGNSLNEITSYFVVVDEVKYRLPNILSAVDTCFKVIWAVNAVYPPESQNVWSLLQVGCYKLKTRYDKVSTAVHSMLTQLRVENEEN